MIRLWFYRVCKRTVSRDTTDGILSCSTSMRVKRVGIKTRRPRNGMVRSGLNKIQNLWKARGRKKKNERRTGREEERAGNGRTGSTYSRGGASQWIWIKMGWRKGGDTRGKPESKRGRRDNWKGSERKSEIEKRGRKSEGMRKMQYILGVVERVGGYGALSFCLHEKTRYSRYPCMVAPHDWHISNWRMLMTI